MGKALKQNQKQPKRILIGSPSLDGRVDAWFCFAVQELSKQGIFSNIDFSISLLSYESILPMARNELLMQAIQGNFDGLLFLDSDVYCNPGAILEIIASDKDVVNVPTVKKTDVERYDISFQGIPEPAEWLKAETVSTSCLYLSKKALTALDQNSSQIVFRDKPLKNICQYDFAGGAFIGEDIYLCHKLKTLGFDIWVNTNSTCMHIGPKVYTGNFRKMLEDVNQSQQRSNA